MQTLTRRLSGRWPLLASMAVFLVLIVLFEFPLLRFTQGVVIYPSDAAYLQMAEAKALAFKHSWQMPIRGAVPPGSEAEKSASWGEDLTGPAAAHASPETGVKGPGAFSFLYSWVLAAAFMIFGTWDLLPLLLNIAAVWLILRTVHRWLRSQAIGAPGRTLILSAVVVLAGLPVLAAQGMEDTMAILWAFLLVYKLSDWLGEGKEKDLPFPLVLYAMLVVTTRYEGIFLVGTAGLWLLFNRRLMAALELIGGAMLPLISVGLFFQYQTHHFIPYPDHWWPWEVRAAFSSGRWLTGPDGALLLYIFLLLILIWIAWSRVLRSAILHRSILFLLTGAALLQWIMGPVKGDWLGSAGSDAGFPWHAIWLVALMVPLLGVLLSRYIGGWGRVVRWALLPLIAILLIPIGQRIMEAAKTTRAASLLVYRQDYQMGRFLLSYYGKENAAIADLGTTAYLTNNWKLDLGWLGAGSSKPWEEGGAVDSVLLKARVKVAVVSDRPYNSSLLQNWTRIASWQTDTPLVPGNSTILSFYAPPDTAGTLELKQKLEAFQSRLPPGVEVKYY